MRFLSPTGSRRFNEAVGFLLLLGGLGLVLSLVSYNPMDASWDTATSAARTSNLLGRFGACFSDFILQCFGLSAYLLPVFVCLMGWRWVRSAPLESPWIKVIGGIALWLAVASACGLVPDWHPLRGLAASGVVGLVIADFLVARMNPTGAAIMTAAWAIIAIYLISTFEVALLARWFARPIAIWRGIMSRLRGWAQARRERAMAKAREKAAQRQKQRQRR